LYPPLSEVYFLFIKVWGFEWFYVTYVASATISLFAGQRSEPLKVWGFEWFYVIPIAFM